MGPSEPTNPYEAPRAELDVPAQSPARPANLENAMAGGYDFTVGEVMEEAWRLVRGMKASFWGAAVVIGLIYLVFDTICSLIFGMLLSSPPGAIVKQIYKSLIAALMTPFTVGISMMCVRRALGEPVSFSTAFSYFNRFGVVLAGAVLVFVMTYLGLALLIIPGIYLATSYSLTSQLICDQQLPAWRAMETSRRAIHHKWWRVLGLGLLVGLLTAVSALGLLIPLIWTTPWLFMTIAVLYRRIFHAQAASRAVGPPAVAPAAPA